MTSIKPPSGPVTTFPNVLEDVSGASPASRASPAGDVGATDALSSPDRAAPSNLHGPSHTSASTASTTVDQTAGAGASGPVDLTELARAVECGQLSMTQAVDRLVEGTVGNLPGQLTALERAELSELLRQAVQSDPTLGALRDER